MDLSLIVRRVLSPIIRAPLPGFDAVYYQYWYRDVLTFGAGPVAHYLAHGWREERDPSAGFSTSGYLNANPDVVGLGICPLVHFLEIGLSEGRQGWKKDPKAPAPAPKVLNAPMKFLPPPSASGLTA